MIPDHPPAPPGDGHEGTTDLDALRDSLAAGRPLVGSAVTTLSRLLAEADPAATEDSLAALPAVRALDVYRTLIAWAPIVAGEKVLDVGCGSGGATRAAAEAVGEDGLVIGVDHAANAVAMAERRTPDDLPVLYRVARAERLEGLPDRGFDAAICSLLLDQMDDLGPTLVEIARVLRPGGRLVASVMDWDRLRPADGPFMGSLLAVVARHAPGALAGRASRATIPDEPLDAAAFRDAGFLTPEERDIQLALEMPDMERAWAVFGRSGLGGMLDAAGREALRAAIAAHLPRDVYLPIRLLRTRRPG